MKDYLGKILNNENREIFCVVRRYFQNVSKKKKLQEAFELI